MPEKLGEDPVPMKISLIYRMTGKCNTFWIFLVPLLFMFFLFLFFFRDDVADHIGTKTGKGLPGIQCVH